MQVLAEPPVSVNLRPTKQRLRQPETKSRLMDFKKYQYHEHFQTNSVKKHSTSLTFLIKM